MGEGLRMGGWQDDTVSLVKVDVEGAEFAVGTALRHLLKKQKDALPEIVMEITPGWWRRYGVSKEQGVRNLLRFVDMGYTIFLPTVGCNPIREDLCDCACEVKREDIEVMVNQTHQTDLWFS